MNCTSIHKLSLLHSQPLSAETLAAIHESAKERAHALRREAVSGLIDDIIAWVFHRGNTTRHVANPRSEATCRS
jgi:hypothetical protein